MTLSYRTYRLEPIYEAQFGDSSYGYRPGRSPHRCLDDLGRTHFDSFWNGCDPDDLDKADLPRTYLRLATKGHSLAGRPLRTDIPWAQRLLLETLYRKDPNPGKSHRNQRIRQACLQDASTLSEIAPASP